MSLLRRALRVGVLIVGLGSARAQTTERVSVATGGGEANGASGAVGDGTFTAFAADPPSLSGDARFVAFVSEATNLVPNDTNAAPDLFVRDRLLGATLRASTASNGAQGSSASYHPALSEDGRALAFVSQANDLDPLDLYPGADVFVKDLVGGATQIVSLDPGGGPADLDSGLKFTHLGAPGTTVATSLVAISARGRFVAFASRASNLVPGDTIGWDVFVRDLQLGTTTRESVATGGAQANGESGKVFGLQGNLGSGLALSADGRIVAFPSEATNLDPGVVVAGVQLYVRDRQAGTTRVVSFGPGGQLSQRGLYDPCLSADGRMIAFSTPTSNWVLGDATYSFNVFLRDRLLGTTVLVDALPSGAPANQSLRPALDASGTRLVFECSDDALLPPDANVASDVYLSRGVGPVRRISRGLGGADPNSDSLLPSISARGNAVAFVSAASNLIATDTNGVADVFVRQ